MTSMGRTMPFFTRRKSTSWVVRLLHMESAEQKFVILCHEFLCIELFNDNTYFSDMCESKYTYAKIDLFHHK